MSTPSIAEQLVLRAAAPHATPLELENRAQIARLEKVASSHLPTPEKTDPLLFSFHEAGLIPKSFRLVPEAEKHIQSLFNKWSLDSEICLIDLIGLDLYDKTEFLSGIADWKAQILEQLGSFTLLTYLFILRTHKNGLFGPLTKKAERFFANKPQLISEFKKIIVDLGNKKRSAVHANTKLDETLKKGAINRVNETIDDLERTLRLLIKCFDSKYSSELLIDTSLAYFTGSKMLACREKDSKAHLLRYIEYIHNLFAGARKKEIISVDLTDHFIKIKERIKKPDLALPNLIFSRIEILETIRQGFSTDLQLAMKGMTHAEWLHKKGIKNSSTKTKEEFFESLVQSIFFLDSANHLLRDCHRILENQVLPMDFPGYISMAARSTRYYSNLATFGEYKIPSLDDCHPARPILRKEIEKIFSPLLAHFHDLLGPEAQSIDVHYAPPPKELEFQNVIVPIGLSSDKLERLRGPINVFALFMKDLPEKRAELLSALDSTLPLQSFDLEELRQICLEEMMEVCCIAFICRDADAMGEMNILTGEIPSELADFIQLEGIESLLARRTPLPPSPRETPEPVEEAPPPLHVPETPQPSPIPAPLASPKPPKVLPPIRAPKRIAPPPAPLSNESKADPSDEKELFKLPNKNVEAVLRKLRSAKFSLVRTQGGHQIMKIDGIGPQVVVPTSKKDLSRGTLGSIEDQARIALEAANIRRSAQPMQKGSVARMDS